MLIEDQTAAARGRRIRAKRAEADVAETARRIGIRPWDLRAAEAGRDTTFRVDAAISRWLGED